MRCGIRTWEQVIKALRRSNHDDIAKDVELQLLINYSKVINTVLYDLYIALTCIYNKELCLTTIGVCVSDDHIKLLVLACQCDTFIDSAIVSTCYQEYII